MAEAVDVARAEVAGEWPKRPQELVIGQGEN